MASSNVTRRDFVKGGLAAGVVATLAACGRRSSSSSNAAAGTEDSSATVRYYISNPDCIDHYNLNENQGTQVGFQLYDSLTDYDYENDELVGKAADSWDVNEDATVFTFHLHEGATFHNGEAVNSAAFKRGWTRVVSPTFGHENAGVLDYHLANVQGYDEVLAGTTDDFSGLSCPDDNTFVVTLTSSYADFPIVCSHPALAPAPQAAEDDPASYYKAPIGNGPFQMDGEWVDGQYINLKRYDDYYGDKARVAAIQFNIQKDVETAYREFTAGNYDVAEVPAASIKDAISQYGQSDDGYTATPGKQVLTGSQLSTYYMGLNCNDDTLKDVNLRRAISLAINRQAICDTLYNGIREPASDILPPKINGYEENAWQYSHYDKDAAIDLLDQYYPADSKGNRNVSIQISYNPEGGHKEIMEMVQADLTAVGINATSDTRQWSAILDDVRNGNYQACRMGWIADYPTADNFLYANFMGDSGDNISQYNNETVNEDLAAARQTVDDAERVERMKEVDKLIGDDVPVVPIMYYSHDYIASDKMASFYLDAGMHAHLVDAVKNA